MKVACAYTFVIEPYKWKLWLHEYSREIPYTVPSTFKTSVLVQDVIGNKDGECEQQMHSM